MRESSDLFSRGSWMTEDEEDADQARLAGRLTGLGREGREGRGGWLRLGRLVLLRVVEVFGFTLTAVTAVRDWRGGG